MTQSWQATKARTALPGIIDAAVDGMPQIIRRRDGKEVVVVSRAYFDATRPNLRDYLLNAGHAPDGDDGFDRALRQVRKQGLGLLASRRPDFASGK